jgi:hypothetical protein
MGVVAGHGGLLLCARGAEVRVAARFRHSLQLAERTGRGSALSLPEEVGWHSCWMPRRTFRFKYRLARWTNKGWYLRDFLD